MSESEFLPAESESLLRLAGKLSYSVNLKSIQIQADTQAGSDSRCHFNFKLTLRPELWSTSLTRSAKILLLRITSR